MTREEKIQSLRQQAATCRRFADHQNTIALSEEFLQRARDYEERADKLDRAGTGPEA